METPYAAQPAAFAPPRRPPAPSTVVIAALLTWVTCSLVIIGALLLAAGSLAMDSLWDTFYIEDARDMQQLIVLATTLMVVTGAAACLAAQQGMQGRTWALVTWGVLSVATLAVSAMWWSLGVPALVTVAAGTVLVLLLTPSARAWPRTRRAALTGSTP